MSWKWECSQLDTLALEPENPRYPAVVRPFTRRGPRHIVIHTTDRIPHPWFGDGKDRKGELETQSTLFEFVQTGWGAMGDH